MNRVDADERARIVAQLEEGLTPYAVSKQCGRSRPTVLKIAHEEGMGVDARNTKKATEMSAANANRRRVELVARGLQKAEKMLDTIEDAGEFQKWTVGVGTLIDKDLLLSGKPTNINENRKGDIRDVFSDLDRKFGVTR